MAARVALAGLLPELLCIARLLPACGELAARGFAASAPREKKRAAAGSQGAWKQLEEISAVDTNYRCACKCVQECPPLCRRSPPPPPAAGAHSSKPTALPLAFAAGTPRKRCGQLAGTRSDVSILCPPPASTRFQHACTAFWSPAEQRLLTAKLSPNLAAPPLQSPPASTPPCPLCCCATPA